MSVVKKLLKPSVTTPCDLVHFCPYPGRLVQRLVWDRHGDKYNHNGVIVKKGVVDPRFRHPRKGIHDRVAQGAELWAHDVNLAQMLNLYLTVCEWYFEAEDPALIWEIEKGSQQKYGLAGNVLVELTDRHRNTNPR